MSLAGMQQIATPRGSMIRTGTPIRPATLSLTIGGKGAVYRTYIRFQNRHVTVENQGCVAERVGCEPTVRLPVQLLRDLNLHLDPEERMITADPPLPIKSST
jgi:hypothetical protein